jgi:hypothetical protein
MWIFARFAINRGHVVPFHELGHVESIVVAGGIETVAGVGRIGLDEIVRANVVLWLACGK